MELSHFLLKKMLLTGVLQTNCSEKLHRSFRKLSPSKKINSISHVVTSIKTESTVSNSKKFYEIFQNSYW